MNKENKKEIHMLHMGYKHTYHSLKMVVCVIFIKTIKVRKYAQCRGTF